MKPFNFGLLPLSNHQFPLFAQGLTEGLQLDSRKVVYHEDFPTYHPRQGTRPYLGTMDYGQRRHADYRILQDSNETDPARLP